MPAYSVDRQCASGLDAILAGLRSVEAGDSNIVVAGGAEALSTAPWRVTKPRNLYQLPRFVDLNPTASHDESEPELIEASEGLAQKLSISRERQDIYALESHLKASQAQDARRFVGVQDAPETGQCDHHRATAGGFGAAGPDRFNGGVGVRPGQPRGARRPRSDRVADQADKEITRAQNSELARFSIGLSRVSAPRPSPPGLTQGSGKLSRSTIFTTLSRSDKLWAFLWREL